jgi:tetratricopeptide (TPR) repeat protein
MSKPEVLPQSQVIDEVYDADSREFSLFLGAGASRSSGVPLASEMIQEWRRKAFRDRAPENSDFEAWCKQQPWCGKDGEYSTLFGMLYKTERARQAHIEKKIRPAFPSWCYLYLANVVQAGFFNVIFTTNFDDLVNEALTTYLGYNPVVCAADSEVMSISITTDRAKIIKLHGDYLFKRLKNTGKELKKLNPNMERKLKEFAKQCGMVVIGYAGGDHSVMRVLEELMKDENSFPRGIYWGLRSKDEVKPAPRVKELATMFPDRFHLFKCEDFDLFMAQLHTRLELSLPDTVIEPYEALRKNFQPLVRKMSPDQSNDPTIKMHAQNLEQELNRPWAKANRAEFDLLEGQMALGKRDYEEAIARVSAYCEKQSATATALTTWGDALAMKGEEEPSEAAFEEAAARWTEAIRVDPQALPPRYSLSRYYVRTQKKDKAIAIVEDILKLVPNDNAQRRILVTLYGSSGRLNDALKQVEWLLGREPEAADLYALKAAALERRGMLAEAVTEAKRAVELNPQDASYHFALANGLTRMSRWDEATVEFNKAIELEPNTLGFRLQVVDLYWGRGQLQAVVPHLEAAVRIEPGSAEARGRLGEVYMHLGRLEDARRETEAAFKLSPQDSRLLANVGIVYSNLNRLDLAEQYLLQAAALNPSLPQPYLHLCNLYWRMYRDRELQGALLKLRQLAPQVAQQWAMGAQAGEAQFNGNRVAAAAAIQRQALMQVQQLAGQVPQS